jgi:hypothetical protein
LPPEAVEETIVEHGGDRNPQFLGEYARSRHAE